jgi:hypothetical protein
VGNVEPCLARVLTIIVIITLTVIEFNVENKFSASTAVSIILTN